MNEWEDGEATTEGVKKGSLAQRRPEKRQQNRQLGSKPHVEEQSGRWLACRLIPARSMWPCRWVSDFSFFVITDNRSEW